MRLAMPYGQSLVEAPAVEHGPDLLALIEPHVGQLFAVIAKARQ